jgi:hypothetical protein
VGTDYVQGISEKSILEQMVILLEK